MKDIKVPRTGRTEEDKFSPIGKWRQGKIVFARWDATYRNRIDVDYPGGKGASSIVFSFTLEQWKNLYPFLELLK